MDKKLSAVPFIKVFTIVFSIFWVLVVGLDYFNKHPNYIESIKYFAYPKLLIFIVSTILIIIWHYRYDKVMIKKLPVNGLSITLLTFFFSIAVLFAHKDYSFTPTTFSQAFYGAKWTWEVVLITFIIVMVLKSIGQYTFRLFLAKHIEQNPILEIALGIMLFVFVIFILGMFKLLSPNSVLATLFVFALLNLFDLVKSFKQFFFRPIDISEYTTLGIFAFCFLLFYLILNFQSSIGPFPSGFDSRNFYVNISKLMAESGSLVVGFQPYNWSIFMGIGFLLFNKVELALSISYLGVILVLFSSFQLAKNILKIDVNWILVILALFVSTPAIMNQMTVELKVDFGMLFYQFLTLYYTIKLLRIVDQFDFKNGLSKNIKTVIPSIILIGVLSGFALGIKMINMFMVFAILILFWWDFKNKVAVFGILCFAISAFLFAGIDTISGLNKYHLSANYIKYGLGILSLIALTFSFIRYRKMTTTRLIITTIYLFFTGIMIAPWMVKNYSESTSLSARTLLMGKEPGPNISVNQMIKRYERTKAK